VEDPHRNQPVLVSGRPLDSANAAVILVHGRGASARDILSLSEELDQPEFAYLAPEAAGNTWYPYSFLPGAHCAESTVAELGVKLFGRGRWPRGRGWNPTT
jgi:predicted esterase